MHAPKQWFNLILLLLAISLASVAHAKAESLNDGLQQVGKGHLTWWGISVYHATLYSMDGRYQPDQQHALQINYRISVSAEKLAERSLDEIEQIFGPLTKRQQMIKALQKVFCDVDKGDTIIGYNHPGQGAAFYCNGQRVGYLDDPELAEAFFAIWLHPETSEPELRRELLGAVQ